ncbi:hypothetical protein L915_13261 [Phytophthora nicotianae]|uniref:RxLR effector protein n=1 Tax=Phytophthora nicotianae TaxID=4792 RepID=W2GFZ8_PHYNI|nr:hypothetical protein L915_13261 [Phytophthora nicotianae]
MSFNVFIALLMITFVTYCACFVCAENGALIDSADIGGRRLRSEVFNPGRVALKKNTPASKTLAEFTTARRKDIAEDRTAKLATPVYSDVAAVITHMNGLSKALDSAMPDPKKMAELLRLKIEANKLLEIAKNRNL